MRCFQKIAKYYYSPGFHEPNGTGEALVSIEALQELPDDLKEIIGAACAQENAFSLGEAEWNNAAALKKLVVKDGVELREYPSDIISAAKASTVEVMEELAATDELTSKIVTSYRDAATHLDPWSKVSIKAFLASRG